jgi:hypothetical protein
LLASEDWLPSFKQGDKRGDWVLVIIRFNLGVVVASAIATAIVIAIGLDVVATAIGADKVGEKAHLVSSVVVWYGSNIRIELQGRKHFGKISSDNFHVDFR